MGFRLVKRTTLVLSLVLSVTGSEIPCSVDVGNLRYDLCPLLRSQTSYLKLWQSEDTPPTKTKKTYEIGLSGALKRDVTLPGELQCPEGTWICLTVINTRPNHPSEPSRVLQVVPIANGDDLKPKFRVIKDDDNATSTSLRMTLHGGMYTEQRQKAAFVFQCDRSRETAEKVNGITTSPQFLWSFNGTHAFEWKSSHACPEEIASKPPKHNDEDHEDGDSPPADPDADEPPNGTTPPDSNGKAKTMFAFYPLLWVPSLFLIFHYRKRLWTTLLRRVGQLSGHHRTRSLGPPHLNIEATRSDYEVYGDFSGGLEGEEIPLSPSPRNETFSYGVHTPTPTPRKETFGFGMLK